MRREIVGDKSQCNETAGAFATLMKDTSARDWYRWVRRDRLHVQKRHSALRGVFASVAGREIEILIHAGIRNILHRFADRYIWFAKYQLSPERYKYW